VTAIGDADLIRGAVDHDTLITHVSRQYEGIRFPAVALVIRQGGGCTVDRLNVDHGPNVASSADNEPAGAVRAYFFGGVESSGSGLVGAHDPER